MRLVAGQWPAENYFCKNCKEKIDNFTTVILLLLLVFLIFVQLDKKEKLSNTWHYQEHFESCNSFNCLCTSEEKKRKNGDMVFAII